MRKLGFQVADKDVARVLVELHNKGLFAGGLLIVGTLAYMAWLNELGASAISSRTQDGAQCIPVKLPSPERFVWHKLYSSASRSKDPSKAQKDALQAATLAAVLVEQDDASLADSAREAPAAVISAARTRLPQLRQRLAAHPQALDQFEQVLSGAK